MRFILIAALFLGSSASFAQSISITGQPSDSNFTSIKLTVKISGVDRSSLASTNQTDIANNLAIFLPDFGKNAKLPIIPNAQTNTSTPTNYNYFFYWQLTSALATEDTSNSLNNVILTYDITIFSNPTLPSGSVAQPFNMFSTVCAKSVDGKTCDQKQSPPYIRVAAQFVPYTSGTYVNPSQDQSSLGTYKDEKIQQIFSSPNGVPGDFAVSPTNKAIALTWTTKDVDYVPVTDPAIKQTPPQVLVMVFNNNETVKLAGYTANATGLGTPVTCTYAYNTSGTCIDPKSCTYDSGSKAGQIVTDPFWITDEQNESPAIQSFTLVDNDEAYTISNLTNRQKYVVMLQYDMGIGQTTCYEAEPVPTYSLSELNGGPEAREGDPRCFIVSAAYGSAFNRNVSIFRWGRDHIIEELPFGHEFVEFYYSHSQPLADYIKTSPATAFLVRLFLYPIAFLLYGLKESTEYPYMFLCFAAFLCTLAFWMRRKRLSRS